MYVSIYDYIYTSISSTYYINPKIELFCLGTIDLYECSRNKLNKLSIHFHECSKQF